MTTVQPPVTIFNQIHVSNTQIRRTGRKPIHQPMLITGLGVFQVLFGTLFLSLGSYGVLKIGPLIGHTAGAPFWMCGTSFFSGYLAIVAPRFHSKKWKFLLTYTSSFSCLLGVGITVWMFILIMKIKDSVEMPYISLTMGLSILMVLDTGLIAAVTCSTPDHRSNATSSAVPVDPPPAYFDNRVAYFGDEDFGPPPSEAGAPPPYEP